MPLILQAAPSSGSRLTARRPAAKAAAEGLSRTTSSASASRPPVARLADSDSDTDVTTVGRRRPKANMLQQTRLQSKGTAPVNNKQQPAESDSDDELMRRRSIQSAQPANTLAQKAKLTHTADRRSSRDSRASTTDRPPAQSTASNATAIRQKTAPSKQPAAAFVKLQSANVESTDNDSDEEHWRAMSARPPRPRPPQAGPVQVCEAHQLQSQVVCQCRANSCICTGFCDMLLRCA